MISNDDGKKFIDGDYLKFQKYGVKIGIRAARKSYLNAVYAELSKIFPNGIETVSESEIEYQFTIRAQPDKTLAFYQDEEKLFEHARRELFYESVESKICVTIAEFAVGKVFLHAGVVGWKGRAIVIPATSFSGKTTLVAELVKRGAQYYSDEYAVLDAEGKVEPFPEMAFVARDYR